MENQIKIIAKGRDNVPHRIDFEMKPVVLPEQPGIEVGIEQTKDVVIFGIAFANGVIKTLGDGKVTIADIPNFLSAMVKLPAAISGIDFVPGELKYLKKKEVDELVALVKSELEVDDAKAKEIIQASVDFIYAGFELLNAVKGKVTDAGTEKKS